MKVQFNLFTLRTLVTTNAELSQWLAGKFGVAAPDVVGDFDKVIAPLLANPDKPIVLVDGTVIVWHPANGEIFLDIPDEAIILAAVTGARIVRKFEPLIALGAAVVSAAKAFALMAKPLMKSIGADINVMVEGIRGDFDRIRVGMAAKYEVDLNPAPATGEAEQPTEE